MKSNGASLSSLKAVWFPSVFDIVTAKAFRLLINNCFHRGNHNKLFVSCCLKKHQRDSKWKILSTFASCCVKLWKIPHKNVKLLRENKVRQKASEDSYNNRKIMDCELIDGKCVGWCHHEGIQDLIEVIYASNLLLWKVIILITVWFWLACFQKLLRTVRWQKSPQTHFWLLIWPRMIQNNQSGTILYS